MNRASCTCIFAEGSARALDALMRALRLTLVGVLLCSQEALSLRVPPPRSQAGQHVSRRRWLAGAGAAAAASAVPALAAPVLTRPGASVPYRTYQPPLCCTYQRHRTACPEAPRTVHTPACQPRVCVTTGQRCAVVRLLVARPGAGRGGAGALDRPARRHQLEDRRVGVRRQQPCRGLPRRWV